MQPKLVVAYSYIAQKTFEKRMAPYAGQFEREGFFVYQNARFYSDGRIEGDGRIFDLNKARFEPFRMSVKQDGWFGPKLSLKLHIDQDVIRALFDFILKNPTNPVNFVEANRRMEQEQNRGSQLLEDVVALMAKISSVDGHIDPREVTVVKEFLRNGFQLDDGGIRRAISVFNNAKESPQPFEFHAHRLRRNWGSDIPFCTNVLDALFLIASADQRLSAEEELLLNQAESILGTRGPAFSKYREERDKEQERRQKSKGSRKQKSEEEHLWVLGLSHGATPQEIKSVYRRLVMHFHPDRVQQLQPRFREEAEQRMKEINEAYGYLKKLHGF